MEAKNYNNLNAEEINVIINKGTEKPFIGKFTDYKEDGIYTCKQCNAQLYKSNDKFDSHCGWPSFDDEIEGAVKRVPDKDGRRVEIVCATCGGHLGHVFEGENFTPKNMRHCVNSISLNFVSADSLKLEKAIFAGGCFWGIEYHFQNLKGVIKTDVGYTGGKKEKPSYQDVCHTNTGHAEAIEITFNPSIISYEELAKLFFEIHDPTQINRQGPDIGEQYRSEIFYTNESQKQTAEKLINNLKAKGYDVVTKLTPAQIFWTAEEYHQEYYTKKGDEPYCHIYKKRF
ncbi:MAG: methionine sulfoxide reductase [Bacteroidetes bacterium GWF2_33_38]|nr:MAG: methionine sulfoxide reductase [Bacteroidetes bacterium GWF2_33_38]OFY91781.1 MAG: methionine sulfoxide reductase [Bacteroidetes bacterium RIFOXYA2_FULL_33_7]